MIGNKEPETPREPVIGNKEPATAKELALVEKPVTDLQLLTRLRPKRLVC